MNKVFVACSSSDDIDNKYLKLANELGIYLATNKYTLVYGGSFGGEMNQISDAMYNKCEVISVVPKQMNMDATYRTDNTMLATYKMLELSDIVIILPGGIGSLMELSTAIHLKKIGELNKRIIVINYDGFYDLLLEYFDKLQTENFLGNIYDYIEVVTNIKQLGDIL